MYDGTALENKAQVLIQNQLLLIEEKLATLKLVGESENLDISICLINYSESTENLTSQSYNNISRCIGTGTSRSGQLLKKVDYLIDKFYNIVSSIVTEINLCSSDFCFKSLIDYIILQSNSLKTKIELEQTRAQELYDLLVLLIETCQSNILAQYTFSTSLMWSDIEDCYKNLLIQKKIIASKNHMLESSNFYFKV